MQSYSLIKTFHMLCGTTENDRADHSGLDVFEATPEARLEADEMAESIVQTMFCGLSKRSALLWILLRELKAHFRLEAARQVVGWERREVLTSLKELVENGYLLMRTGGWYEVIDPPKKKSVVLKIGRNGLPIEA